jgi:hypothetical protein
MIRAYISRMNRTEFVDYIGKKQAEGLDLIRRKNADYGADSNPFQNFELSAHLGIPVDKAIVVRMSDKLQRIANLLDKEAKVADESIEDTLLDLANYTYILLAYRTSRSSALVIGYV